MTHEFFPPSAVTALCHFFSGNTRDVSVARTAQLESYEIQVYAGKELVWMGPSFNTLLKAKEKRRKWTKLFNESCNKKTHKKKDKNNILVQPLKIVN